MKGFAVEERLSIVQLCWSGQFLKSLRQTISRIASECAGVVHVASRRHSRGDGSNAITLPRCPTRFAVSKVYSPWCAPKSIPVFRSCINKNARPLISRQNRPIFHLNSPSPRPVSDSSLLRYERSNPYVNDTAGKKRRTFSFVCMHDSSG